MEELAPYIAAMKKAYINHEYAILRLSDARDMSAFVADKKFRTGLETAIKDWAKAEVEKNRAEKALLDAVNSYKFW